MLLVDELKLWPFTNGFPLSQEWQEGALDLSEIG